MLLLRIEGPNFVVGVVIGIEGRVRHVPPLVSYMRGWTKQQVRDYARGRGWQILQQDVPDNWRAL